MAITNVFREKVRHPSKTNTWITMRDVVSKDSDVLDKNNIKWSNNSLTPINFNFTPIGYSNIEKIQSGEKYDSYNLKLNSLQYEKQNERTNHISLNIEHLDVRYGQYSPIDAGVDRTILTNINKNLSYYFYYNNKENQESYIDFPSNFHFIPSEHNSAKKIYASIYPEDIIIFAKKREDNLNNIDYFYGIVTSINNFVYTIKTNIEDIGGTNKYHLNRGFVISGTQDIFNNSNITFYTAETGTPAPHVITETSSSTNSAPKIVIYNPYCVYGSKNNFTRINVNNSTVISTIQKENRIDRKVWMVSNLNFGQNLHKETADNTYTINGASDGATWFSDEFYEKVVEPYYKKLLLVGQVPVVEQECGYVQEEKIRYYDGKNNLLNIGSEEAPMYIEQGEFKPINVNLNDLNLLPSGTENIAESITTGEEKVISIENINGVNVDTLKEIAFTNINNANSNVLRIIEEEGENNG